jgi:selenocysteine-specific elongation factor
MRVVATAGHVDHGKSTLIRALTGIDPDRLPEEKARGLTIDLGFAAATLPSGAEVAFVDVPGHGRFVGNMLAGAGSVDACLFVVAATEGWKPQSEEHLRILQLLGIAGGVVALTKVAAAGDGQVDAVGRDVRQRLAGTLLDGAEVVAVDVPAGIGVDDLGRALDRLVQHTPAAVDRGRPRLWIDRSFARPGAGTVVTGTLRDGRIAVGDEMTIEPGGRTVRVRGLQSHHQSLPRSEPGRRLAVSLHGASRQEAERGQTLVRPGQWHLTDRFDASLAALPSLAHPVGHRGAYRVHLGSGDFPVRIRILGTDQIAAGEEATARFWLTSGDRIPLVPGDRYVLREAGRFETVGGGEVLDVEPILPASRAQPSRSTDRTVRERGWVDAHHLARLTGEQLEPTLGRWVVDPETLAAATADLMDRVRQAGTAGLAVASLDDRQRVLLDRIPEVTVADGIAVDRAQRGTGLSDDATRVLAILEAGGWSPPDLPLTDRGALRELQRAGLAVEAGPIWFARTAVRSAVVALRPLMASHPGGFTVGEARDALGSTRRSVVPLLAYLDSVAVTRRRGDQRTPGPRLDEFAEQ